MIEEDAAPTCTPEPQTAPGTTVPATGPQEIGGRQGPDPTRFGDWEKNGRCIDF